MGPKNVRSISNMMTESQAHVAFNLVEGVGSVAVGRLITEAGSAVKAWEQYPNKQSRTGGQVDWQAEYLKAKQFGVTIVTLADAEYPSILKESPGAPLALYVKGDVAALSKTSLAIVGTRRPTSYGLDHANRFAYDLSKSGFGIISGLALGIDAEAHHGALAADGVTVGVIGSGLDVFYPEENRALAREIVKKGGAVVSQFPFGRPPDRETFPIRNHVVASLARGLIAVEAPARSGTLITAGIATDLGRTVMALPGRVDNRASAGCLQLIRDGAILVRNADDVLEAMSDLFPSRRNVNTREEVPDQGQVGFSAEESLMMLHVDECGVSLDELSRLTGFPADKTSSLAMALRLRGFVRYLPGNRIATIS